MGFMGLFKRATAPEPDPRLNELLLAVRRLEVDVEELQKDRSRLEMEWEDWFEKFRNLYARINKRHQREDAETVETPAVQPMSPMALRLLNQGQGK